MNAMCPNPCFMLKKIGYAGLEAIIPCFSLYKFNWDPFWPTGPSSRDIFWASILGHKLSHGPRHGMWIWDFKKKTKKIFSSMDQQGPSQYGLNYGELGPNMGFNWFRPTNGPKYNPKVLDINLGLEWLGLNVVKNGPKPRKWIWAFNIHWANKFGPKPDGPILLIMKFWALIQSKAKY